MLVDIVLYSGILLIVILPIVAIKKFKQIPQGLAVLVTIITVPVALNFFGMAHISGNPLKNRTFNCSPDSVLRFRPEVFSKGQAVSFEKPDEKSFPSVTLGSVNESQWFMTTITLDIPPVRETAPKTELDITNNLIAFDDAFYNNVIKSVIKCQDFTGNLLYTYNPVNRQDLCYLLNRNKLSDYRECSKEIKAKFEVN